MKVSLLLITPAKAKNSKKKPGLFAHSFAPITFFKFKAKTTFELSKKRDPHPQPDLTFSGEKNKR